MTDVAALGFTVDSDGIVRGNKALSDLVDAANDAGDASDRFERDAKKGSKGAKELGESAGKASVGINDLAKVAVRAGGAIAAAFSFAKIAQETRSFSDAMAEVSTLVDTATVSMTDLNKAALEQAKTFGSMPVEQGKALYQIISAGASDAATATATLDAANRLAVGGVTDVATAADGLTSVLNAYGPAAGSAVEVSDAMFVAMRAGKTTIGELSSSLGSVAPLAAQVGISFDELVGATAALTKGGISTSESMTGLRAIMAAVAKPAKEASDTAAELGIQFDAAGLKAKGLSAFMADLVEKTGGSQEKMALLFGGVEALVPALALAGQAGADLNTILDDMANKSGATAVAFDKIASSPGFQMDQAIAKITATAVDLGNKLLTVAVPALEALNKHFDTIITVIGAAATAFVSYKAVLLATTAAQTAMAGSLGIYLGLVTTATRSFGLMAGAQVALAGATAGVTTAIKSLTAAILANPLVWFTAAITGVVLALKSLSDASKEAEQRLYANADAAQALGIQLSETSRAALAAANENRSVGSSAAASEPLIWGFKNATDNLTQSLWEQAKAARAARVEMLKQKLAEAKERESAAQGLTWGGARNNLAASSAALREGDLLRSGSLALDAFGARWKQVLSGGRVAREAARDYDDAIKIAIEAKKQLDKALSEPIGKGDLPKAFDNAAGAAGGLAKSTGGAAKATRDLAKAQKDTTAETHRQWLIDLDKDARALAATLGGELEGSLDEVLQRLGRMRDHEGVMDKLLSDEAAKRIAGVSQSISSNLGLIGGVVGGGAGNLINSILNTEFLTDGEMESLADKIGKHFADVWDEKGPAMANLFASALAGAGIGAGANSLLGGNGSAFGGAIGGALGGIAGEAFKGAATKALTSALGSSLGGALGAAVPVVGSLVGGLLGGVIGGAFKKTKRGEATISGGSISVEGNSGKREDAANDAANSVLDSVKAIADALGANLDLSAGSVSVSLRKKDWRVDTTGQSISKVSNGAIDFGQDQAAALKYAISDLIGDGVLGELPEIIANAINGSGDFDKRLEDALSIKGVFDYIEQAADPAAYASAQLEKQLTSLKAVFEANGATADDLAKFEEFSALRRKEVLEQFGQDAEQLARDRAALEIQILTGQGRIMEAVAAARQLELAAMDASLQPLQEQIYAMQDAAQRRELEIQLLEATGLAEEALAERRADYLATLPENLRAIQMQIYAAQDASAVAQEAAAAQEEYNSALASARNELASAYNREASALQATADRFRGFADSLKDFRASLYGANSGLSNTTALLAELMKMGALAASGNETGLAGLQGAGTDYLSALKNTAKTAQEYARGVALVANYADQAANAATGRANGAEAQIRIMERQLEKLGALDDKQLTFNEAMQAVKDLLENPVAPEEPTPVSLPEDYVATTYDTGQAQVDALDNINRDQNRRLDELNQRIVDQNAIIASMASNMASMAGIIKRVERQGRFATVEEA